MAPSSLGRQVVACHAGPGLPSWFDYVYVMMRLEAVSSQLVQISNRGAHWTMFETGELHRLRKGS
jgi:hypothetical protein